MATLLYGAGLRLMECVRLQVKDLDFSYHQIVVRGGKGHKDRVTMLPLHVKAPLQAHLRKQTSETGKFFAGNCLNSKRHL